MVHIPGGDWNPGKGGQPKFYLYHFPELILFLFLGRRGEMRLKIPMDHLNLRFHS